MKGLLEYVPGHIWIAEHPVRFCGFKFLTRMTIIRLAEGDLFIHSPVDIPPELKEVIDSLGRVKYIIAPNRYHQIFFKKTAELYPGAETYGAPNITTMCKDLVLTGILKDTPETGWAEDLDQMILRGNKTMQEVVFLHKKSKTLILTDFIENFHDHTPGMNSFLKLMLPLARMRNRPSPCPEFRLLTGDRKTMKESLSKMLEWDFERAVIAHGELLEENVKEVIAKAYSWL